VTPEASYRLAATLAIVADGWSAAAWGETATGGGLPTNPQFSRRPHGRSSENHYWRGRALGRAMATDSPELGKGRLADQQAIAEYERGAEAMKDERMWRSA
jgi:hypothetical protein